MRIALVVHGFPPRESTGVEIHAAALASALVRAGAQVEVFAPCRDEAREHLSIERVMQAGYAVSWIALNQDPRDEREALEASGIAAIFARWLADRAIESVQCEHVLKLGIGILEAAARAGVPIVCTAHDFHAVSPSYTLLAPDMSAVDPRDASAAARLDLARRWLDRDGSRWRGHHGGILPRELEADDAENGEREVADVAALERNALRAILHGDPTEVGFTREDVRSAVRLRRDLERARRDAFQRADVIVAPTQYVANTLRDAGCAGARIEVRACGIDVAALEDVTAARLTRGSTPLRFGYFGSLARHKGVHVLLDAFAGIESGAELSIHGGSHDERWVERIQSQCLAAGARYVGPYAANELADRLSEVDVVVVPSIWPENAPFVIREAFAARRPVIASRIGAMSESVRDGIDGLLVEPGDASALRAALERCIREEDLVASLADRIAPVRTIDEDARDLITLHRELRARPRATPPAHAAPFVERVQKLERLSRDEIVDHVVRGLDKLRASLAPERANEIAGTRAIVAALSRSRHGLRAEAVARENAWRASVVSALEQSVRAITAERDDHAQARASLDQEVRWLRARVNDHDGIADANTRSRSALVAEVRQAREATEAQSAELASLRAQVRYLEAERAHAAARDEERVRESAWKSETLAERDRELSWLRTQRAAHEEEIAWRKRNLEARDAELETLRAEMRAAVLALSYSEEAVRADRVVIDALTKEVRWREAEMRAVRDSLQRARFTFVGRALRERAQGWVFDDGTPRGSA